MLFLHSRATDHWNSFPFPSDHLYMWNGIHVQHLFLFPHHLGCNSCCMGGVPQLLPSFQSYWLRKASYFSNISPLLGCSLDVWINCWCRLDLVFFLIFWSQLWTKYFLQSPKGWQGSLGGVKFCWRIFLFRSCSVLTRRGGWSAKLSLKFNCVFGNRARNLPLQIWFSVVIDLFACWLSIELLYHKHLFLHCVNAKYWYS